MDWNAKYLIAYSLKFIWFIVFPLGLSIGQIGSGLGLSRIRPDWIWLPATNPIYESIPAVRIIGWTGRIRRLGRFGLRIGPTLWICMNFFLLNFWQAFWARINVLTFNKDLYIFEPCIYIIWASFHIFNFKMGLQAQLVCHYTTLGLQAQLVCHFILGLQPCILMFLAHIYW